MCDSLLINNYTFGSLDLKGFVLLWSRKVVRADKKEKSELVLFVNVGGKRSQGIMPSIQRKTRVQSRR